MNVVRAILILFACMVVLVAGLLGFVWFEMDRSMRELHKREAVLLYQVNHQQLLDASRLIWQNGSNYGHDEGGYFEVAPDNPKLPAPIRSLSAHDISVFPSGVNIELGGQGEHYGFESIFSDPKKDTKRMVWKDDMPSTQLLPELWFYAENGIVPP